jgi:hypothetical protein
MATPNRTRFRMTHLSNPGLRRSPNRLADEPSPYLRQHQFNPVDWHPWGETAFALARAQDRPIFLSVGYSTCHWCHVMERESFEDPSLAEFLNAHYLSIKVDREERPDVDRVYMTYVQATTGGGGWPMSVFLTPDLKPFFGGTYFPPERRHGRPGFLELLREIHRLWTERRSEVLSAAEESYRQLTAATAPRREAAAPLLSPALLERAVQKFQAQYDPQHGGFGGAPKFPRPSEPRFLLARAVTTGDAAGLEMVVHTCRRMAAGGIHDQLGGGFARYAVDAAWAIPHFEKMLYDNAQLLELYLDVHLLTGDPAFAPVAQGIADYVLRDLTSPEGGFYSAEDADSEGKEGRFYCWTLEELRRLLTPEQCDVAVRYYGVSAAGNFLDHSDPDPLLGQNVLQVAEIGLSPDEQTLLSEARRTLAEARARRIRPHRDEKILASWNGLMLGALARAGRVLDQPRFLSAAQRNLAFLRDQLWDPVSATLYHRWCDGRRDEVQLLEAYAFLLKGVLDLYECTLEPESLEFALSLTTGMIERFHDPANGGFWQGSPSASDLILPLKEDYDGALPSGNSLAVLGLLRLGHICDRGDLLELAGRSLEAFAHRLQHQPHAVPQLLTALDWWLEPPVRVLIQGPPAHALTTALLDTVHRTYGPRRVILGNEVPVRGEARPLPDRSAPAAQVCSRSTCLIATSDPAELRRQCEAAASHRTPTLGSGVAPEH